MIWQFVFKEEKHTAVSGDQSLFELLQSPDDHMYVYRGNNNNIFSDDKLWKSDYYAIIAERKPVVYIPAIGDKFTVKESDVIFTCHFIDREGVIFSHDAINDVYYFNSDQNTFTKA